MTSLPQEKRSKVEVVDKNYLKELKNECENYLIIGEIGSIFEKKYLNLEGLILFSKTIKLLTSFEQKLSLISPEKIQKPEILDIFLNSKKKKN